MAETLHRAHLPRTGKIGHAAIIALAVCGCSDSPRPDTMWGSAQLTWTIASDAGASCATLGATRFVALLVARAQLVDRYEAACSDFALEVPLLAAGDDYIVNASLQDDRGTPKTNGLNSSPFRVRAGELKRIEIRFGADAWIDVKTGFDGGTGAE